MRKTHGALAPRGRKNNQMMYITQLKTRKNHQNLKEANALHVVTHRFCWDSTMNSDNDPEHHDEIIAEVSRQEMDSLINATANEQVTSDDDHGDIQSKQLSPPPSTATATNKGGSKQAREQKPANPQRSNQHEGNNEDTRSRRERQNRTNEEHPDYRVRMLRENHQRVNEVAPVVQTSNRNRRTTPSLKETVRTTILAGAGSYVSAYGTLHIHVNNANRLMAEMSNIRVIGTRCYDSRISSHGLELITIQSASATNGPLSEFVSENIRRKVLVTNKFAATTSQRLPGTVAGVLTPARVGNQMVTYLIKLDN